MATKHGKIIVLYLTLEVSTYRLESIPFLKIILSAPTSVVKNQLYLLSEALFIELLPKTKRRSDRLENII